ncbi:MAG: hypothetical protein Q4C98_04070, partial [Capnocytophaga sp.]|nr:hypothetical protein [Capnocytophaga sp.]
MEINENFRAIYRFSIVNFEKEKAVTYNRKVKIQRIPWENEELLVFHVLCLRYQWDSPHTAFEIEKATSVFNNLIVLVNKN